MSKQNFVEQALDRRTISPSERNKSDFFQQIQNEVQEALLLNAPETWPDENLEEIEAQVLARTRLAVEVLSPSQLSSPSILAGHVGQAVVETKRLIRLRRGEPRFTPEHLEQLAGELLHIDIDQPCPTVVSLSDAELQVAFDDVLHQFGLELAIGVSEQSEWVGDLLVINANQAAITTLETVFYAIRVERQRRSAATNRPALRA